jgi:hypothetical protein
MPRCTTPFCTNFGSPLCNACKKAGADAASAAAARAAAEPRPPPPAPQSGLSMEEQLERALRESASAHTATIKEHVVSESYTVERRSGPAAGGAIRQVGVLNQFHAQWLPLIAEHGAPAAICGYTAFAHAVLLAELAGGAPGGALPAEPAALRAALCDFGALAPRVGAAMASLRAARRCYVAAHAADFAAPGAAARYEGAWVANFELSDLLRGVPPDVAKRIVFVRINESPALGQATHEERVRLQEEVGIPTAVFVEAFAEGAPAAPARRLLTPTEALAAPAREAWRVAAIDVHGHFVVAAVAGGDLVVLNTTNVNYLNGEWGAKTTALAYDLLVRRP